MQKEGFTLLELIFVIILLGLLAAIALPVVSSVSGSRNLEIAAQGMAMEMRRAQQVAITTKAPQRIEVRVHNQDYRIRDLVTNEVITFQLPEGITFRSVNFPYDGWHYAITFYPTGAPSRGGTVGLTDTRDRVRYIIITPATGRVKIADNQGGS